MTHGMDKNLEKSVWDVEYLGKQYPMFTTTHQYLMKKYNKNDLSVDETLFEIKMSSSDFYEKKKKGIGIPCYRQSSQKSRIYFPIVCVAIFLSQDFVLVN